MKKKPWTEAYAREALMRTYEIAAEIVGAQSSADADTPADGAFADVESEAEWRKALHPYIEDARINREVRRVRALAEGRLAREPVKVEYQIVEGADHVIGKRPTRREAEALWTHLGRQRSERIRRVRVTRIRRA